MTAGKGNQVIKCEKSEAGLGSLFCSVSFPNAAVQLWPPRRAWEDGGPHKGSRLPGSPRRAAWLSGSSKSAMSCSSVTASHQLEKLRRVGPLSQDTLYAPGLHCLGADVVAPGAWPEPNTDRKGGRKQEGEQAGRRGAGWRTVRHLHTELTFGFRFTVFGVF